MVKESKFPFSIDAEVIASGDPELCSEWNNVVVKLPQQPGEDIYRWCRRLTLIGGLSDRLRTIVNRFKYDCINHFPGMIYRLEVNQ